MAEAPEDVSLNCKEPVDRSGNGQVQISWSPPAKSNGKIVYYQVRSLCLRERSSTLLGHEMFSESFCINVLGILGIEINLSGHVVNDALFLKCLVLYNK